MISENKIIRILFLIDQIERLTAGSEQHLLFLINNLPKERYHTSLGFLRSGFDFEKSKINLSPFFFDMKSFYRPQDFFLAFIKIKHFIANHNIDIIHTFFPDSDLLSIFAKYSSKSISTIAVRRNFGYWHTPITLLRSRFTNKFIPHFLANCEAVKIRIGEIEKIPLEKIDVIYNPVNQSRLKENLMGQSVLRSDLGITSTAPLVGIVANMRPVKDYETFFRAARMIADKVSDTHFVVVGSGDPEYKLELRKLIYDLGLSGSVIDAGEQDNPIPFMRLFDIGLLTSKSEGLSNTLIEYGSLGIPAVATDVGGTREIVNDGKTGFLVPPGSPEKIAARVIELLENDSLRKKMGLEARKYVTDKFNPETIVSAYDRYYTRIYDTLRQ